MKRNPPNFLDTVPPDDHALPRFPSTTFPMKSVAARLAALWPVLFLASAAADEGAAGTVQPPASQLSAAGVSVVTSKTVTAGDHNITFVRITPPVLPQLPAPIVPPPSAAEQALAQERAGKTFAIVAFSAVVFPGPVTELSWQHDGRTYRAYSNVDFRLLTNVSELETSDSVYTLIFAANLADPTTDKTAAPLLATLPFSPDHAEYVLANPAADLQRDDPTPAAITALQTYYDLNQAGLLADYARRAAAAAANQSKPQAAPVPKPHSTVFFWPIQSRQDPP